MRPGMRASEKAHRPNGAPGKGLNTLEHILHRMTTRARE